MCPTLTCKDSSVEECLLRAFPSYTSCFYGLHASQELLQAARSQQTYDLGNPRASRDEHQLVSIWLALAALCTYYVAMFALSSDT
jgi:hypothetical protein